MIIYKIKNLINGKVYVGQTRSSLDHRISQHLCSKKSLVAKDMLNYGINNFEINEIDKAENIEELNKKERYWIKKLNSISPNGYNVEEGGFDAAPSEVTRKKISNTLKGRYVGDKNPMYGTVSPMRGKTGAMKGRKHSAETIEKMRKSRSGLNSKVAKKVINLDTGEVFYSQKEASEKYNITRGCICAVCKGKQKKAGGYRWAYYSESK